MNYGILEYGIGLCLRVQQRLVVSIEMTYFWGISFNSTLLFGKQLFKLNRGYMLGCCGNIVAVIFFYFFIFTYVGCVRFGEMKINWSLI